MSRYYMGIDIGTSQTKGLLLDQDFEIVCQCSQSHTMENPQPNFYEQDAMAVWWNEFCLISQRLIQESGIDPTEIAAVGGSTLGSDCLPVDEHCNPLRKAILYGIDSRSQQEIAWLTEHYGPQRVKELFGRPICSGDVAAKILWIKNNEPEIYEKTHHFLTGSSFLVAKLTGNYVVDQFLGQASFKPLYRSDGTINQEECALYCRPDQLAEARWVHSVAGHITPQAAQETGIPAGTPVITGTGDSTAEAISAGVLTPGDMMIQFGSTLFFYCCTDHLVLDDRMRGNNFCVPNTFSMSGGTNTAGSLTQWYRDTLFPQAVTEEQLGGPAAFQAMTAQLDQVPPGSDGLITLPYFSGERTPINDPNAKGMIFGLTLAHSRHHLYRSALEGIGYSIAQHLDILREHEVPLQRVIAVGGGTKNPQWMQIVADICGVEILVPKITLGASYGDALMAALGVGDLEDFQSLHSILQIQHRYQPNPTNYKLYQPYRQQFDLLYQRNKDLMHQLPL